MNDVFQVWVKLHGAEGWRNLHRFSQWGCVLADGLFAGTPRTEDEEQEGADGDDDDDISMRRLTQNRYLVIYAKQHCENVKYRTTHCELS